MRLHIEGQHTHITPHVLGWIAQRLEHLNTPHQDIDAVDVTLVKHEPPLRSLYEARVELRWTGQTLHAMRSGETLPEAAHAVWAAIEHTLGACRITRAVVNELLSPQAPGRHHAPRATKPVEGVWKTRFSLSHGMLYRHDRDTKT